MRWLRRSQSWNIALTSDIDFHVNREARPHSLPSILPEGRAARALFSGRLVNAVTVGSAPVLVTAISVMEIGRVGILATMRSRVLSPVIDRKSTRLNSSH